MGSDHGVLSGSSIHTAKLHSGPELAAPRRINAEERGKMAKETKKPIRAQSAHPPYAGIGDP
jgi:hypothetical protein